MSKNVLKLKQRKHNSCNIYEALMNNFEIEPNTIVTYISNVKEYTAESNDNLYIFNKFGIWQNICNYKKLLFWKRISIKEFFEECSYLPIEDYFLIPIGKKIKFLDFINTRNFYNFELKEQYIENYEVNISKYLWSNESNKEIDKYNFDNISLKTQFKQELINKYNNIKEIKSEMYSDNDIFSKLQYILGIEIKDLTKDMIKTFISKNNNFITWRDYDFLNSQHRYKSDYNENDYFDINEKILNIPNYILLSHTPYKINIGNEIIDVWIGNNINDTINIDQDWETLQDFVISNTTTIENLKKSIIDNDNFSSLTNLEHGQLYKLIKDIIVLDYPCPDWIKITHSPQRIIFSDDSTLDVWVGKQKYIRKQPKEDNDIYIDTGYTEDRHYWDPYGNEDDPYNDYPGEV